MKGGQQTGNMWNTQIAIISIAAHAYKTRARGLKSIGSIGIAHRENHQKLRADRQFAVAYLKAALEDLDDPNNRAAGLLAVRDMAEAYGWFGDGGRASRHRPGSALPLAITQRQPDLEDPAGSAEVGRDEVVSGAGELCACVKLCQ
jgi:hypothetical protein